MAIYIYGLECPVEQMVRYVGKSTNPPQRFKAHLSAAKNYAYDHHAARWIRRLLADGMKPKLIILHEVCEGEIWQDVEREFIASAPDRGWRLTNSTAGGEGLDYRDPEDEARYRANLKRAMDAYNATPEGRARMVAMQKAAHTPAAKRQRNESNKRKFAEPEMRLKMAEVGREIGSRPEVIAAKSSASKSMWANPDMRARFMEGNARPEKKAKQSARKKASWADPVVGAKLRAIHASEDVRRKKSEAARRRATPEYRAMMAEKTRASWAARKARESKA